MIHRFTHCLFSFLLLIPLLVLTACDSEPPVLMKATKQFESEEKRQQHIDYMRTHHMHALKHKRDETMYNGIRTEKHSLNACIDCHVPSSHNGKVLRHTDQEHFCTTCHTYVAQKLNCFECHVDHPVETKTSVSIDKQIMPVIDSVADVQSIPVSEVLAGKDLSKLSKQELIDLAFTYTKDKPTKSGGVSFNDQKENKNQIKAGEEKSNESF